MSQKEEPDIHQIIPSGPEVEDILNILQNTSQNVFITGRAGTGKSTLLSYFRTHTNKKLAVLAPTGIAALNIKGQTIHSFFGFGKDITLEKVSSIKLTPEKKELIEALEMIIIDEISMVRSDHLDCIDKFLEKNRPRSNTPFGGVQMIFIGDLFQLPPVLPKLEKDILSLQYEGRYFFHTDGFKQGNFVLKELTTIYRQSDPEFKEILDHIRTDTATTQDLMKINTRYKPKTEPANNSFIITVTTLNDIAENINTMHLDKISTKSYEYQGSITGEFPQNSLPTYITMKFKIGAQIMTLYNEPSKRWFNGTMGKITNIIQYKNGPDGIEVELENGNKEVLFPHTWENYAYSFDVKTRQMKSNAIGSFTQYPIKLAWAITIHKSQGKTFEKVIIDIGPGTFEHGQLYVALSRCKTLEGITLKQRILPKDIQVDKKIVDFLNLYTGKNKIYSEHSSMSPLPLVSDTHSSENPF